MKIILEIARTELKRSFYSPVSWFILIVFTFQFSILLIDAVNNLLLFKSMGRLDNLTHRFFASDPAMWFFMKVQGFLFLYFPLITMNSLSRDLSSGSIRLLYSSPVSDRQIILGKYVSLLIFGSVMLLVVALLGLIAMFNIDHADWPVFFNGLTGLLLMVAAYSAVGLFLSSLTTYAIVAAILTFAALSFLSVIGNLAQVIPFVRDITYWFSLNGRSEMFIYGLISSEAIIYFLAFIGFFISLAILRLRFKREKRSPVYVTVQYLMVLLIVSAAGYLSSRPSLKAFVDVTYTQMNTLSPTSQDVLKMLKGKLTLSTYSNMLDGETAGLILPKDYKQDISRYDRYTRFKPEMEFNYTYYYKSVPGGAFEKMYPSLSEDRLMDTLKETGIWNFDIVPYAEVQRRIELKDEFFRLVTVAESGDGKRSFLRTFRNGSLIPSELHITTALKRLVEQAPQAGFVTGHEERSITNPDERGYSNYTADKLSGNALVNLGFDVDPVDLTLPVPDRIGILVIADVRTPFSGEESKHFREFLSRGGNLFIAGEPGREQTMNPLLQLLGVQLEKGMLVQPKQQVVPEVLFCNATKEAETLGPRMLGTGAHPSFKMIMPEATHLTYRTDLGFKVTELFRTDSSSAWNELQTTDLENDSATYDPQNGEERKPFVTALALSRQINKRTQRIIVTGDADWLSNEGLGMSREGAVSLNADFFYSVFYHLSGNRAPIIIVRKPPVDNSTQFEKASWKKAVPLLKWGLTGLVICFSLVLLIRRKGR